MHLFPLLNEDLYRLHHLIKTKSASSPQNLAKKLGCSESSVYNKIKELKEMGLPVAHCKHAGYHYTEEVNIEFAIKVGDTVLKQIIGGQGCLTNDLQNNFATPDYLECKDGDLLQNSTTPQAQGVAADLVSLPKKINNSKR